MRHVTDGFTVVINPMADRLIVLRDISIENDAKLMAFDPFGL